MARRSLYIFDFDGLLVDTERVYRAGWRATFDRVGLDMPDAELEEWVGKSIDDTRAVVTERFGDPGLFDRLYAIREEYVYDVIDRGGVEAKPYALEALEAVHRAGVPVCIVSSSWRRRVMAIIERLGAAGLVDYLVCAEDVDRRKPSPDPYLKALGHFGCPAGEAVAFEDSLTGRSAALAAGVGVWLVPDTSSRPFEIPEGAWHADDLSIVLRVLAQGEEG
ncbi:MAG: HAD family phosphatase [Atopobiaceae bacterium]|nr:HAD family phosphatase [Atopobiaceae bacterium]